MPISNITYAHRGPDGQRREGPEALFERGPILQIEVSVDPDLARELEERGEEIPAPATGFALIDTGATVTAIDETVVERLELAPVGTTQLGTAGGPREVGVYAGEISFPGSQIRNMTSQQLVGVDVSGQTLGEIHGPHLEGDEPEEVQLMALIGRDILSRMVLVYNGPKGMLTITI